MSIIKIISLYLALFLFFSKFWGKKSFSPIPERFVNVIYQADNVDKGVFVSNMCDERISILPSC